MKANALTMTLQFCLHMHMQMHLELPFQYNKQHNTVERMSNLLLTYI